MEMTNFAYKRRIQIETLVDFGDMGGWEKMRSPCNVEYPTTTHIIIYIYPQIHLYMGKLY